MGAQPTLDRLLAAAIRRLRIADAAWAVQRLAVPAAGVVAAIAIVGMRRLELPAAALWLCVLPLPAAIGWALVRHHDRRRVARRLDAFHQLDDQLGAALELTVRDGDDPRTKAIVELARSRGEALAATVDPRPATPIRLPRPSAFEAIGPAVLLLALLVPPARAGSMNVVPLAFPHDLAERALARAKVDMATAAPLRQSLRELVGVEDRPAQTAQAILEILDALERGELDRAAALERLEQLEQQLAEAEAEFEQDLEEDPGILSEALEELAGALEEQEITQDAGEALDRGEGDRAEQALAEAEQSAEADAEADSQMSKALAEAERRLGKQQQDSATDTAKKLDEAERRLKREQQQTPKPEDAAEHERRLKQQKQQVEQLRRQHERELAAQKKVEELRRNAGDAAKSKAGSGERQRKLEKLGRGMSQASRTAGGQRRMQGARDALEEAKSLVRRAGQQGSGADKRRQQFRRFEKAAKGKGQKEGQDGKGKDGKGKGRSTLMVEGDVGEGEPSGMVEMDGQSGQGQGQDGEGEGDGEGDGDEGDGQGQDGQGHSPGDGQTPGDGIGEGSQDPMGDPSAMKVNTKNVRVKAKGGRGVSKAEIMRDASQHGFATEAYRETFRDYRDHAQSALDSDAFPAAQRRLVKRYYQLIQGR